MGRNPWPNRRIDLAQAQAEYASAERELAEAREALRADGSDAELLERLRRAQDRVARAAARISELRAGK